MGMGFILRQVEDPVERMKVLCTTLKQTFTRWEHHPQQEIADEDEVHVKSAAFYEAISRLLESYLTTEVGVEKEIHAISEVIDETDA